MTEEFRVERVALSVLESLEQRRTALAERPEEVVAATRVALEPVRAAYVEAGLPPAYWEALEAELVQALPAAWRGLAAPFTRREARDFDVWRGGDLVARLTYVFGGLALGGLCVWLPFIPVWEKWFPFALALGGFWLPTAQVGWQRRRYARALGALAVRLGRAQRELEGRVRTEDLLLPEEGMPRE